MARVLDAYNRQQCRNLKIKQNGKHKKNFN
jgi:hypothetical protein